MDVVSNLGKQLRLRPAKRWLFRDYSGVVSEGGCARVRRKVPQFVPHGRTGGEPHGATIRFESRFAHFDSPTAKLGRSQSKWFESSSAADFRDTEKRPIFGCVGFNSRTAFSLLSLLRYRL